MICDFCSAHNPAWEYPASDFVATIKGVSPGISDGYWAACDACHALIERGDYQGLAFRATYTFIESHPQMAEFADSLPGEMAELHKQFVNNRTGAPRPLGVTA